jgi:hypothetical protein
MPMVSDAHRILAVLQRKHVHVFSTHSIGKESNDLDRRDMFASSSELLADYGA